MKTPEIGMRVDHGTGGGLGTIDSYNIKEQRSYWRVQWDTGGREWVKEIKEHWVDTGYGVYFVEGVV